MARPSVCLLASLSALLLGIAVVSRSKGLRGTESQKELRIPSHFSQEQRIAMKEALKGAIQIPTVSFSPKELNTTALAEFGEYIRKVFPTVFHTSFIRHEVIGNYSHLFTVKGSDPSMQPYMLLAHIDVVPAPDRGWDVPPFSGLERDGFIYGRGTLDNKNSLMAILQALELLLIRSYIPRRSFFIALGHDEEVSGINGAQKISALLQARGVQLAFLVDEGSFILDGFFPNLKKPFAMVSVSEKGAINLMLQVNMTPGHSSAPPKETSIGILAAAVSRLEQTPMPNMFGGGPLRTALEQLADEFPFPTNIVLNNLWLFRPLVSRLMERNYITNSLVRTTTALTMFNAGVKVTPPDSSHTPLHPLALSSWLLLPSLATVWIVGRLSAQLSYVIRWTVPVSTSATSKTSRRIIHPVWPLLCTMSLRLNGVFICPEYFHISSHNTRIITIRDEKITIESEQNKGLMLPLRIKKVFSNH
ncbi:hypothetical protein FD755_011040 [Muntiacus reevesi]|uniref:Peptidase M20 dimerisation domain-containing protein n=1 Tax=Muntiacus reevesi TaxID=9886 RepID=A0A5N3XTT5_MUNRE|nr:hypothetical protein FD755_011040 [Muntiacus reevesi]